jgi:hypothetical protein
MLKERSGRPICNTIVRSDGTRLCVASRLADGIRNRTPAEATFRSVARSEAHLPEFAAGLIDRRRVGRIESDEALVAIDAYRRERKAPRL